VSILCAIKKKKIKRLKTILYCAKYVQTKVSVFSNLEIGFTFKVGIYVYHHGNVCNATYIWRIDEEATEEEILN